MTPTFDITYSPGSLRVDCNEIGFRPKNVEAICKIGKSTKAGGENKTRYVGEKGIGFKSVFKVADVVHIASNFYTFKFDKNAPLGMIAPIWSPFPQAIRPGFTSIFFELSPKYDESELIAELQSLEARMLLFLRQVRHVNIHINNHRKVTRSITRMPDQAQPVGRIVELREDDTIMRYVVTDHKVKNMPIEEKREGHTDTSVLLAFPISDKIEPVLEPQQAYAFLPIRNYGFQVSNLVRPEIRYFV